MVPIPPQSGHDTPRTSELVPCISHVRLYKYSSVFTRYFCISTYFVVCIHVSRVKPYIASVDIRCRDIYVIKPYNHDTLKNLKLFFALPLRSYRDVSCSVIPCPIHARKRYNDTEWDRCTIHGSLLKNPQVWMKRCLAVPCSEKSHQNRVTSMYHRHVSSPCINSCIWMYLTQECAVSAKYRTRTIPTLYTRYVTIHSKDKVRSIPTRYVTIELYESNDVLLC